MSHQTKPKPSTCCTFDWSTYTPDDVAVLCFIRRTESKDRSRVLLIRKKRGLGAGKINAPGGKTEAGETARDAAIRETEEEVGLRPHNPVERGRLRFAFCDGYKLTVYIFTADTASGVEIETDEALPIWFEEEQIPFDEMWEDDRYWLPKVLAGCTVDAEMVFDGDVMCTWDIRFSDGTRLRDSVGERDPIRSK